MKIGAGEFGEFLRLCRVFVGHREKAHRRMSGGKPRPQAADTAGTDDGNAEVFSLHVAASPSFTPRV
jgi:hypothetical protein